MGKERGRREGGNKEQVWGERLYYIVECMS